jgi:hypothetical protein
MAPSKFDDWELGSSFVLGSPDYEAQLCAIRGLLRLHGQTDEALSNEIKALEAAAKQASGRAHEFAVDDLGRSSAPGDVSRCRAQHGGRRHAGSFHRVAIQASVPRYPRSVG